MEDGAVCEIGDRGGTRITAVIGWRTRSVNASLTWLEARARRLRAVGEVRSARVASAAAPPRAGIVLSFDTGEAYERFCHEHLPDLRRSMERSPWTVGGALQQVLERTGA